MNKAFKQCNDMLYLINQQLIKIYNFLNLKISFKLLINSNKNLKNLIFFKEKRANKKIEKKTTQ